MPSYPWQQLPFNEAIDYFASKQNIDTNSWRDLQGLDYDVAFAVAGAKGDLLQDMRSAVEKAIVEGTTLQEFRKDFDRIVQARGWSYSGDRDWRTNTIYSTNLRTAYAGGRWEQIQQTKAKRPYLQWRHGGSRDPRPLHIALDRKVFSLDDPFWQSMGNPPIGHGCRCSVFALGDRDLERLKLKVEKAPVLGSDYGGIPVEPDPGWGGGHGRSNPEQRAVRLKAITDRLHPTIAAQVKAELAGLSRSPGLAVPEDFDQLDQWDAEYDRLLENPNLSKLEKSKIKDGKWVAEAILDDLIEIPGQDVWLRGLTDSSRVGLLDSGGLMQSVALVSDRESYMYIDYITVAPWNLSKAVPDPRQVKSAGKALIANIAQESIGKGYGGRIRLSELNATPYERMGFVKQKIGDLDFMELSPESAIKLIEDAQSINFTDSEDEIDEGLLTASKRPVPSDYDPLVKKVRTETFRSIRLKREAENAR